MVATTTAMERVSILSSLIIVVRTSTAYLVTSYQTIKNKKNRRNTVTQRTVQMGQLPVSEPHGSTPNKCFTITLGADRLSWKTTHHFRRMLRTCALAAYADALKKRRYDRSGMSMCLRLPETPWEEKHHEGEES